MLSPWLRPWPQLPSPNWLPLWSHVQPLYWIQSLFVTIESPNGIDMVIDSGKTRYCTTTETNPIDLVLKVANHYGKQYFRQKSKTFKGFLWHLSGDSLWFKSLQQNCRSKEIESENTNSERAKWFESHRLTRSFNCQLQFDALIFTMHQEQSIACIKVISKISDQMHSQKFCLKFSKTQFKFFLERYRSVHLNL